MGCCSTLCAEKKSEGTGDGSKEIGSLNQDGLADTGTNDDGKNLSDN